MESQSSSVGMLHSNHEVDKALIICPIVVIMTPFVVIMTALTSVTTGRRVDGSVSWPRTNDGRGLMTTFRTPCDCDHARHLPRDAKR